MRRKHAGMGVEGASLDTDGIEILGWRDPWTDEPVTMGLHQGRAFAAMRRKPAGMWLAAGALALVSCTNGSPAPDRLVDYAEGDWACDIDAGTDRTVDAAVTVTADGAANGAYTAELVSDGTPPTWIEGEWELDGTDLQVTALDEVVRYAISGAELDSDHVEVVEGGRGHVPVEVGVDVERHGDDVAFSWSHPLTDEPVSMDCAKA